MASIIIYDPENTFVANRVVLYDESANTALFDSEPNKIINPDISAVSTVEEKYWKVDTGNVVEMTAEEKVAINASENQILRYVDGYNITSTSYIELLTFDRAYNEGIYTIEITCLVCCNRSKRTGDIKISLNGDSVEIQNYCHASKIFAPFTYKTKRTYDAQTIENIKIEAKANGRSSLFVIHDLIIEIKELKEISETGVLNV